MPSSRPDSAYDILGVAPGADASALRRAFRALALKHHPDAVPADQKPEAGLRFARINQAYELLRDPERRRRYDELLARGITPDLSQQAGAAPGLPSLAEILGEIHSLKMEGDLREQTRAVSADLTLPLLQSLVKSGDFRETVYDTLRIARLVRAQDFDRPPGSLSEAWVVVTDLRLLVLMLFVRRTSKGRSEVVEKYVRGRSFPYLSLENMEVREVGRAFRSYRLVLTDEDGASFTLKLRKPRFTRLFLVANTYRLPLKTRSQGSQAGEYVRAFFLSLLPLLVWLLPFFGTTLLRLVNFLFSSTPNKEVALGRTYARLYRSLGDAGLTTLALYLPLPLFAWLAARVYCAWRLGRADSITGPLAIDCAGLPQKVAVPEVLAAASPPRPSRREVPLEQPQAEADVPAGPLDVEVPEAVREADREPLLAEKNAAWVAVFCPHCGKEYRLASGRKDAVHCGQCGRAFEVET